MRALAEEYEKVYTDEEYKHMETKRMSKQTCRRILHLYKSMIPSTRLCGHCQLEEMARQGLIEYRHCRTLDVTQADLDWADTVLLSRLDCNYELRLAKALKTAGRTLIYMIDDDLLHVPLELASGAYFAQKEMQRCIPALMSVSDAILSPSKELLGKYALGGVRPILTEEPAINPVAYQPYEAGRSVRIGFAGTVDRTGDIERILGGVLLRLKKEFGSGIEFYFFGAIPAFAAQLEAKSIPYCDSYDKYREVMNGLQLDIGLAPMPGTAFHACKHYNKFVEYAAAGVVGVYSLEKPYTRLAEQFGWPLLCPNEEESWYEALHALISSPEEINRLKRQLAEMSATVFSVPVIARELYQELCALPSGSHDQPVKLPPLPLMKLRARFERYRNGLKRYGLKAPALVWSRIKAKLRR